MKSPSVALIMLGCVLIGFFVCLTMVGTFFDLCPKSPIKKVDKEVEIYLTIDSIRYAGPGENTSERIARTFEQIMDLKENR